MTGFELASISVSVLAVAAAGGLSWWSIKRAGQANKIAKRTVLISKEGNRIARESNEIARRADARVEAMERERAEYERAAVLTIAPIVNRDTVSGYYPFEIANIGKARANGVKVRWWMMYALDHDQVLVFLLSESFPLGDIRPDESATEALCLYLPPTAQTVDIRFQLTWDDRSGERYHHSEFIFWFHETKSSRERIAPPFFVGSYLDGEIHPTFQGRIARQQTEEHLEKLTGWLSIQKQPNAPTEWTRFRTVKPLTE